MLEDMPDRMPEDMSDRMPEDMPDRMSEDLPVTKHMHSWWGSHEVKEQILKPYLNIWDMSTCTNIFSQFCTYSRIFFDITIRSGNRQTLYLLGFPRVACNSSRCGGNACICDAKQPGYPATLYDWEANGTALLETAKAHLRILGPTWSNMVQDRKRWEDEGTCNCR